MAHNFIIPDDLVKDITITALLILDNQGSRLFANYFPDYTLKSQLLEEEQKANTELKVVLQSPTTLLTPSADPENSPTSVNSPDTATKSSKTTKQKKPKPPSRFEERQKLFPNHAEQLRIESAITSRISSKRGGTLDQDVLMFEKYVVVYTQYDDLRVIVLIKDDENELIGSIVLSSITQTLGLLFDNKINKNYLVQAMDLVFLLMDEICDDGYIAELEPETLLKRVSMRNSHADGEDGDSGGISNLPPQQTDINLSSAFNIFFTHIKKEWTGE